MPRPPTWTIEVRCKDGDQPPLTAEVSAHTALEALAAASTSGLDATWPDYVTVIAHPSSKHGHQFQVSCRCGADWGFQDRRNTLRVLRETIPNHHGWGRCEQRWPDTRSPAQPEPLNSVGAEIRQRREMASLTQAQLAKAVGVSPATISTAERVLGGVSHQTIGRIRTALDEVGA